MDDFDKNIPQLLLSVNPPKGVPRTQRPLNPIEVATFLEIGLRKYSKKEISRKLGLEHTEMVRQFLRLLTLPKTIQEKYFSDWNVGIDKGYRISMLKKDQDKIDLTKAVVQYNLNVSDVRGAVYLKRNNPSMSISSCIDKILTYKPKRKVHIFLTGVDSSTHQMLQNRIKDKTKIEAFVKTLIQKKMPKPENLKKFSMKGNLIKMVLTQEGFVAFKESSDKLNVPLDDVVERLLRDWLKKRA